MSISDNAADGSYACFTAAYDWLCRQRKNAPVNADIWHLRRRWSETEKVLFRTITEGRYRLSPMMICGRGRGARAMWSARDALVLKWVALQVENTLPRPEACHHLKGKGVRYSLREVSEALSSGRLTFVHRTDIRGYYEHILRARLVSLVNRFVPDPIYAAVCDLTNNVARPAPQTHRLCWGRIQDLGM